MTNSALLGDRYGLAFKGNTCLGLRVKLAAHCMLLACDYLVHAACAATSLCNKAGSLQLLLPRGDQGGTNHLHFAKICRHLRAGALSELGQFLSVSFSI